MAEPAYGSFILWLARDGVRNVVVGTNCGTSIRRAYHVFGPEYHFFAVGNPTSAHQRSLVLHSGISEETQRSLEEQGVRLALHDQSLFQRMRCFRGVSLQEIVDNVGPHDQYNAVAIIYNVLQLFGSGPRVCVEVGSMAADSGLLPVDTDCMSIAPLSTWCPMPNAAMVLRPAKTEDIFRRELHVKDLALVPPAGDLWFSNNRIPW